MSLTLEMGIYVIDRMGFRDRERVAESRKNV